MTRVIQVLVLESGDRQCAGDGKLFLQENDATFKGEERLRIMVQISCGERRPARVHGLAVFQNAALNFPEIPDPASIVFLESGQSIGRIFPEIFQKFSGKPLI